MTGKRGRDQGSRQTDGRTVALGDGRRVPYPRPRDEAATHVGKGNRRADTKPEVALRSNLHRRGLRFRKDFPIDSARRRVRPDIVFTKARVAVFVDGCFWHCCPDHHVTPRTNRDYWVPKLRRNVARDRETEALLASEGWWVVRVWEHESLEGAADRIASMVEKRAHSGSAC